MLRMFQKEIAMTISLKMRRASPTKATTSAQTEPTQVMTKLSSKITKHVQAKPEAENRQLLPGVERRSHLGEEITILILRRYKNKIFVLRHSLNSFINFLRIEQTR